MIAGADSSGFHPTLAQLQAAYAQGVRAWGFYLPGPGIYSGNTQADFDRAHQAGMKSIGWASGNADPAQQKALAASWSVDFPTLDDEPGIRAYGAWEQPYLDTSGFGLYMPYGADGSRIKGFRAPWYIMADYLGRDPQATWNGSPPAAPHGWQWVGTINNFGGEVDRLWLDDWFVQQGDFMALTDAQQTQLYQWVEDLVNRYNLTQAQVDAQYQAAIDTKAKVDTLSSGGGAVGTNISGTITGKIS